MKIELIFDGEGNLMIVEDGEATYHYCEYNTPEVLNAMLDKIPEYRMGE